MKNERVWRPSLSQAVHLDSVSLADQIVCFQNNKLFDFCSLTLSTLLPDLIRLRKWREMRVVLQRMINLLDWGLWWCIDVLFSSTLWTDVFIERLSLYQCLESRSTHNTMNFDNIFVNLKLYLQHILLPQYDVFTSEILCSTTTKTEGQDLIWTSGTDSVMKKF